ncbi:MAG: OmpA family protein [Bacteroidota bacterium]
MKDEKNKFKLSKNEDNPKDKSKFNLSKGEDVSKDKSNFNLSKSSEKGGDVNPEKKTTPALKKQDAKKTADPTTKPPDSKTNISVTSGGKKKSKAWIFILLAVIVAGIVVALVMMNRNIETTQTVDKSKTPTTEEPKTTPASTADTSGTKTAAGNDGQNTGTAPAGASQKYVKGTTYDVYHFASASPAITGADAKLDELYSYLKDNPKATVKITAYTDNVGAVEYNLALSEQRAAAVFNYLVAKGIDAGRMKYSGKGVENPVADNSTKEGRQKNRRAEFEITN